MFVRVKKIHGQKYAYKVHNSWTKYGPRQKHIGYLGKLFEPKKISDKSFEEFLHNVSYDEYLQKSNSKQIIRDLIELELLNHGFEQASNEYLKFDDAYVNLEIRKAVTLTSKQNEKPVCIKLNQGYLCNENMKELFHFCLEENEEMNIYRLANAFIGTGVNVPKDVFVKVYEKLLIGN